LKRAERALQETIIYGVKTTIPFYLEILKVTQFQQGHITTEFIEQHPELLHYPERTGRHIIATVLAAACVHYYGYQYENEKSS
jgi:pyruvate carboxylase subunit A